MNRGKGNRSTWIGRLFREDREKARDVVKQLIWRHRGVVQYVATDLGVAREHVCRLLWRESLWPELDAARAAFPRDRRRRVIDPDHWLTRTRAAFRKDSGNGLSHAKSRIACSSGPASRRGGYPRRVA